MITVDPQRFPSELKQEVVMKHERKRTTFKSLAAIVCAVILVPGDTRAYPPQQSSTPAPSPEGQAAKIPLEQLDSLVAPIALYPDPLLAQVLAASTYPIEIILLQRWLEQNKNLKDKELADAVAKQPWDASVQALAALPEVVKRLGDEIQWTTDLGNAFLAQQSDVMDSVQRMRKKALDKGTLTSTPQQKVETKVIESKSVIVVEQADPQVVYVPSYSPEVVYGPAYYPYPPIYYPPAGYYAAGMAISFGVGMAMGAFWSGGWGWGAGWGDNDININRNNTFNRNTNIDRGNRGDFGGTARNNWRHNPEHRGGVPYRDRTTADRFGGVARGDSLAQRQAGARQGINRQGGNLASGRRPGSDLGSQAGRFGGADRAGGAGIGDRAGGSDLGGGMRAGGADRIGSRDISRTGGGNRDAFGGGSRGYDGARARNSSNRGFSSASRGGGGFSRGGGGFRGGGRRR
jgi:hypothetical protein